ncbi:uncharacterized protein LOC127862672 isoform X3 [Dreissena polymorpha]|uniref:uncharacterized protein LOC127862672 isoform X3 n=1 Tax=Dreissena polymorpha TaxID=45954 RepID=UPI0022647E1B|nr:uncharacterized protein LOC127862672 isoform X3 [Dreissena polymorpha]
MSYWKRYRSNVAAVHALAESSSDEDQHQEDHELSHSPDHFTNENLSDPSSNESFDNNNRSEDNFSDFSFSETIQSSDSSETESSLSEDESDNLRKNLASWAAKHNVSKVCVDELLTTLQPHCNGLPNDARTLLKTPKSIDFSEKCGGKYIYFGMKTDLLKILKLKSFSLEENTVKLNFNIDGIPLFKSTSAQFWPILCSVNSYTPFMICIFYGEGKPNSLEDFLSDFLTELSELIQDGISLEDTLIKVEANAFICDAPARAFLKSIKGHTGYNACERCTIHGYHTDHRVVLDSDHSCELRTDKAFNANRYRDTGHQMGETPLVTYGINCVKSFALDYMHMVCLGVVKRILGFLKQGPTNCRLSAQQLTQISTNLLMYSGKLPSEFARQPRTLYDFERWKATEFRQFLLYTGPIVLKKVLTKDMYEHFLCLSVGMSILLESDNETRNFYLNYARELLTYFVTKSKEFYHPKFIVYNVHSLIHLADDCEHFNCSLNDICAFPYENHLHSVKKLVKNAKNPIVQVAKRIQERSYTANVTIKQKSTFSVISTKEKNNCFLLQDGTYAFVKEKIDQKTLLCQILKPEQAENFFTKPCESKLFNIAFRKNNLRLKRKRVAVGELYKKLVRFPFERGVVLVPMLHTIEH